MHFRLCSAEAMREYPGVVNRSPADIETTAYQEAQFEVSRLIQLLDG